MTELGEKTVIITGAAFGMGRSHSEVLAASGANVVVADIEVEEGMSVAHAIGKRALFVRHDVSSGESWSRLIAETESAFGSVSSLVNNAGIGAPTPFEDLTEEVFRRYFEINQLSVFLGMKAVMPSMRRAKTACSIVNISSIGGLRGCSGILPYVATKFAVTGMTKAAALDLAQYGIRVNSIHPGMIGNTRMLAGKEERIKGRLQRIPMNRIGEPHEVSNLVSFLVSDDSCYCTGAEFVIDGGQICQQ
jgi:3alpha(or 20beta)-hydroxysteroid dehydrogenase